MSKIELNIGEYFKNANAILPTILFIDAIIQCGNDELIVDLSEFTYLNLENIKHLICLFHLNNPNKTVKFVETVKFEDIEGELFKLKAENDECIKDNEYLKTIIKDFTQEVVKFKQALQEIKEIAENDCETCTVKLLGEDEINCKRCYKTKILQKCEDVL